MSLLSKFLEHPIVTTDSRNCPEGSIFFALKGENFNGNKFAAQALEKGCAYAVVDEKEYAVATSTTTLACRLPCCAYVRNMRLL